LGGKGSYAASLKPCGTAALIAPPNSPTGMKDGEDIALRNVPLFACLLVYLSWFVPSWGVNIVSDGSNAGLKNGLVLTAHAFPRVFIHSV